ncbi:efflux RND transporter periplasmic adaptor subunit [Undibacterium sp. RuRC25W]|uniref:efflux RND transporter periplasmic adaptor subunit n=1 Tax=Undibacterium sp. RuRC25W TaxID=3413047 RepID=UPI003BF40538
MKIRSFIIIISLVTVGYASYRLGFNQGAPKALDAMKVSDTTLSTASEKKPLYWHDPMVPNQRFDKPGKSPFMDMELVPVYANDNTNASKGNGVTIDSRVEQNLGVRTAVVAQGTLATHLTAVGNIAYNERDVAQVQSRSNGFIEHVYVRAPLDPVKKGQKLVDVYVPDWIAAQEEYLTVLKMNGNHLEGMADAARERMRLVGMSDEQINQVTKSGKVQTRLSITTPVSGIVTELTAREGMTINPGAALFRINGVSSVWVNAEVPEHVASQVRPGDAVEARVSALSGVVFKGRVNAVLPEVNPTTRTLKARIELTNLHGELVPGMFATIQFLSTRSNKESLLVPSEAVIQTGTRSVIMVEKTQGNYEPVEIETGNEANGLTEVTKGLEAGQKVVVSGQFLIDSEANLKGTASRMSDTPPKVTGQGAMK